jgi:hypothetical protein
VKERPAIIDLNKVILYFMLVLILVVDMGLLKYGEISELGSWVS